MANIFLFLPPMIYVLTFGLFAFGDFVKIYKNCLILMLVGVMSKILLLILLTNGASIFARQIPSDFLLVQFILLVEYAIGTIWFVMRFSKVYRAELNYLKILIGLGVTTDLFFSTLFLLN